MTKQKANKLINSTSPYLLQHAWNPVNWMEWTAEALALAKENDKPLLVSIGYSSCHWCHVMERECFERDDIAALMNEYFVCIKVDREERPDIDQVYMEAVQAMGGHGGWPLNVFLTPDQKPFYGGTYFPPAQWVNILRQIHVTYKERRRELETNAEQLTQHLAIGDQQRFAKGVTDGVNFERSDLDQMLEILKDRFDEEWGGLEKSPKFVMPSIWMLLLRCHHILKNEEALQMVGLTLTKMQEAGLYDQLGGGFSRYSVDGRWFAPHFEKMLYDNAQFLTLYAEAWKVVKNPVFKKVVAETIGWLKREMRHADGGFYSALDADSEGHEGKFYTWTVDEMNDVLGTETDRVAAYFGVTPEGNWEHGRNILMDVHEDDAPPHILLAKEKLLKRRATRIRPGLDDKILAGWNAMCVKGLADAACAFGESEYLALAKSCIGFIEENMISDGILYRSFKGKRSPTEGFLEDYAFLIQAYTSLYQATFDEAFLTKAGHWCSYVIFHFKDQNDAWFHFASDNAESLIARKKEIFDNVIPASNSVMAQNLFSLSGLLDKEKWRALAIDMVSPLREIIRSEPAYLSNWGMLAAQLVAGTDEVVIVGRDAESYRTELSRNFLPFSILLGAVAGSALPLFEGRGATDDKTRIYVCRDKTCQLPVLSVTEALIEIDRVRTTHK